MKRCRPHPVPPIVDWAIILSWQLHVREKNIAILLREQSTTGHMQPFPLCGCPVASLCQRPRGNKWADPIPGICRTAASIPKHRICTMQRLHPVLRHANALCMKHKPILNYAAGTFQGHNTAQCTLQLAALQNLYDCHAICRCAMHKTHHTMQLSDTSLYSQGS